MRILFWCDAFWPLIGGIEVLAARLVKELGARGHELCVITRREPNHRAFDLFHGIPVHRIEFLEVQHSRDIERWVALREQIATIKREFQPDIVHVYHATIDVLFHLVTSSAHRAPTLCTVHGSIEDTSLRPDSIVDRLLRAADWVTTCSSATLAETRQHFPNVTGCSSVILNGLDLPPVDPTPISFDPPSLLCLGRIGNIKEKGFDLALEAMAQLRHRFPQLRLRIAGDGAGRPALQQLADTMGVSDVVDFLGFVHPDQVPSLLNETSMLLMPSRVAEGFGLVALQASQMERPVIASRVGGVPEVVRDGDTGLLVDPDDPFALTHAIETLLTNPVRAKDMGVAGRRRAIEHFTLTRHVDAYEQLLERLTHPSTVMSHA